MRLFVVWGVCCLVAAASGLGAARTGWAQSSGQSSAGQAEFNRATALTAAGKFAQAESLYRGLVKKQPTLAAAWANLGMLRVRVRDAAQGVAYLEKAVALAPTFAPYRQTLAGVYLQRKRFDLAVNAAKATQKLANGDNRTTRETLAYAYVGQKRFAQAVPILRALVSTVNRKNGQITTTPDADRRNYTLLVFALSNTNKKAEALAVAREFAKFYPGDPNAQMLRGDLAGQQGQMNEAFGAYKEALALAPENGQLFANVALLAEKLNRSGEIRVLLERRVAARPDDARAHFLLGQIVAQDASLTPAERLRQSEGHIRSAMLGDPRNPQYLTSLGMTIYLSGNTARFGESERYLQTALDVAPGGGGYAPAELGLAYIAEQRRDWTKAEELYRGLLRRTPKDYAARRRLAGLLYIRAGADKARHAEAFAEFDKLIESAPKDTVALAELASLYVADGRFEDAERTYKRLLVRDAKSARAYVGLGQLRVRMQMFPQAKQDYLNAIEADPSGAQEGGASVGAYFALADLLANQGNAEGALSVIRRRLAVAPNDNTAHWQAAQFLQTLKRDDEAMREMRAIRTKPDEPARLVYKLGPATLLSARGKFSDAVRELEAVAKEEPSEPVIRYALADALEKAGRAGEGETMLLALQNEAKPGDVRPRLAIAALRVRQNRLEDAAMLYEAVLRENILQNDARAGLLRSREAQKNPAAAFTFFEKIAFADAKEINLPALVALGDLLEQQNKVDDAVALARRAATAYADSIDVQRLFVQTLLTRGLRTEAETDEVATTLGRIAALDAKDATVRYQVGVLRERQRKKTDAIAAYEDALRVDPNHAPSKAGLARLAKPTSAPVVSPAAPTSPDTKGTAPR